MPVKSTIHTTKIKDKREILAEEVAALQKRLDFYDGLPEDDFGNGAVVVFEKKFNVGGVTYTYAAVKGGGFWYLSGDTNRRTWDGLLDYMFYNLGNGGKVSAYWVTEIAELAKLA